ncbi:MAG: RraA family protein [Rhodospirillaceae bacterium]|nr:RraA family protein [Rhodospirillaceae bacterium]
MSLYEIVTDFERPDPALIERALYLYFCIVGCRVGPRYVMDVGIKPLEREWRICGPAVTVRPEQTDDVYMAQLVGKYVKPGDVVVIDAGGQASAACLGASMANGLKEMGAAGIVADGYVLTGEVIRKREGIPVFCRGTVSLSRGMEYPGWINTPAICGGVIVNPGDLILGDEDGVVVVPKAHAEEIISLVEGHGNGREKPGRPRDGNLPARDPVDDPYYKRSGAEAKLEKIDNITIRKF